MSECSHVQPKRHFGINKNITKAEKDVMAPALDTPDHPSALLHSLGASGGDLSLSLPGDLRGSRNGYRDTAIPPYSVD